MEAIITVAIVAVTTVATCHVVFFGQESQS